MRFVIIQSMMQSAKRMRSRFKFNLQPPAEKSGPMRKDKLGLIFILLAISLVVAVLVFS